MAQQFDYPKTETKLRMICDALYQEAKSAYDSGMRPTFKGLIEIMKSETPIVTAIHNIKLNKDSQTSGTDKRNVDYYLQKPFEWVIKDIQSAFDKYNPKVVRRA